VPPAKKKTTAKKTTKKATAKRTAATKKATKKRAAKKAMSPTHKRALAAGRSESLAVNAYLAALNVPKKRGRKVSAAALRTRLNAAEERARTKIGVDRVLAHQEARDLRARLGSARKHASADIKRLEQEFVRVAKGFSERRGISYGAWRDAGVPADVLKQTRIKRTRG
jgi:hypothetical protein